MAKKSRRKRSKSSKEEEAEALPTKGPVILQRIRHTDPKTRHAALSALVHTIFDPDVLASSKKKSNSTLVQAVREQLMDRDLSCAIAAAGCLANYAAFSKDDDLHALTAGWIVLLVGRLKECLQNLPQDNLATASNQMSKKVESWWALTEQCLTCLVHLLENNPLAVDRLLPPTVPRSSDTQQQQQLRQDTMWVLSELLRRTLTNGSELASIFQVQTLCCRCFHSAWDDNPNLVLPWLAEQPEVAKQALELLRTFIASSSATTARLHAVGAWLSLWELDDGSVVQEDCTADCMALLRQQLDWDTSVRIAQVVNLQVAHADHLQQQQDSVLERDILSEQERKKEPARIIARRHKENKESRKANAKMKDAPMEEDTEMKEEEKAMDWDDACQQWSKSSRPVQLALEISANLTSASPLETASMGDDEDEMMMEAPSLNARTAQALLAHGIPDRVVELLCKLSSCSWPDGPLPDIVRETVSDLQSKTAVCLGHCLTNLAGEWTIPTSLWQNLKDAWRASVNDEAREAIGSAMVVALQHSRGDGTTQTDLDFLLEILQSTSPVAVRDAVCMLGFVLSSRQHGAEVNHKVVHALMQAASSEARAMVLSEVLSVLMDIYGDDECHPAVFESLQVLSHFQRSLPLLKQRVSVEREASPEDIEQWKETASNAARFIQYKKGHAE